MSHQFVSVVVPTRNRAQLLRDCLESLLAQDYPHDRYEVIIVDDGSRDETAALVTEFSRKSTSPTVTLVSQPSRGLNAARNAGIAAAGGDPVCFVDDDVEVPLGWLSAMVRGVGRHPEAGCCGGPIRLRLEGKAPRACGREPLGETELDLGDSERPVRRVWGANMAVSKAAVGATGPFLEELPIYGDEEEWEQRHLDAGGAVIYLPEAWLWHRRTAEDLRLWRLARNRFRRGASQLTYLRLSGQSPTLWGELSPIPRTLAHAILRRCAWGILTTAMHLGRVWGILHG